MSEAGKIGALSQLDPSLTSTPKRKTGNDEVNKNEFINLLVTQLKHQDPLDPMKNEEFAVQLAQFSQLEQLIEINKNLSGGGQQDFGSMAAYLGHEVVLNSNAVQIENRNGGEISFNLADDAATVTVELLDGSGVAVERIELGQMSAGKQKATLSDLSTSSGEYQLRVTAKTATGVSFQPEAHPSGVVSGFIPGPEPTLIVGNREVAPADVREVRAAADA